MGKIDLDFSGLSNLEPLENSVSLSPPMPNPFRDQTRLNLILDQAQQVQVEVLDITGRRTFFQSGNYQPGSHQIDIPAAAVPALGLSFYRVRAGERIFVGKLVRY